MKKRFKRVSLLVTACMLASTVFAVQPFAASAASSTYYVSASSGSDTNSGTLASPWKTIQKAANSVSAGDTVIVRGGTYKEKVTMKTSGTASSYITFENYTGETPIIDGAGQTVASDDSLNGLILINGISYVKVTGFSITDYVSKNSYVPAGIRIIGASKGVQILNDKVYSIKTTYSGSNTDRNAHGIIAQGNDATSSLDGLVIDNCEVYGCLLGNSETVVVNGNVTNFSITNNKIHDDDNIGIDVIGYEGTASSNDYARNGVISGNQVYNISSKNNSTYGGDTSADGIYVDGGASVVIEKNKVWSADIGIEAASEHKNKYTNDVTIRNNLVYGCGVYGITIGGYDSSKTGGSTNVRIYNNTVYGTTSDSIDMNLQYHCQYSSNIIKNNIFYGATDYYGTTTSIVISNNITSDPSFVTTGSDFHLKTTSSAINAGVNDTYVGSTDLDGNTRIQGGTVDCGCYECK
jgi:hypothetical protein